MRRGRRPCGSPVVPDVGDDERVALFDGSAAVEIVLTVAVDDHARAKGSQQAQHRRCGEALVDGRTASPASKARAQRVETNAALPGRSRATSRRTHGSLTAHDDQLRSWALPPGGGRRLRGHQLRGRRAHRQDHDLPPRGAQRLPSPDGRRAVTAPSSGRRDDADVGVVILWDRATSPSAPAGTSASAATTATSATTRRPRGIGRLNVLDLQIQIRRLPKPVVAMVAGYAIGGGQVLQLVCDLTICADNARFGQTGPRVGSFDAGYGAGLLARRSARRGRRRSGSSVASTTRTRASRWGSSTRSCRSTAWRTRRSRWCREILRLSPLSLRMLKAGFNAADEGLAGVQQLAGDATLLFYMTEEAQEGRDAFVEHRPPDFSRFPRRP